MRRQPWATLWLVAVFMVANGRTNPGHHADNKALLLNIVRFYCIGILQDLACLAGSETVSPVVSTVKEARHSTYPSRSASAERLPSLYPPGSWP